MQYARVLYLAASCPRTVLSLSVQLGLADALLLCLSGKIVMDWDCDNAILTGDDLKNVFAFEPKATTVIRLLTSDEVRLLQVSE